jgi:hypothetical protein
MVQANARLCRYKKPTISIMLQLDMVEEKLIMVAVYVYALEGRSKLAHAIVIDDCETESHSENARIDLDHSTKSWITKAHYH